MFFDQLINLCEEKNTTPTKFVTEVLRLSSSKVTAWKNGSIPKYETLNAIANYFDVSVGTLFDGRNNNSKSITIDEQKLLDNYGKLNEKNKKKASKMIKELADEGVSGKNGSPQKNKSEGRFIQNISMGNSQNKHVSYATGEQVIIYGNGADVLKKAKKNPEENGKCSAIISHLDEFEEEVRCHAVFDIKCLLEDKYNMDENNTSEDEIFQYLDTLSKKEFGHAVIAIEYMLKQEYDVKKNNE